MKNKNPTAILFILIYLVIFLLRTLLFVDTFGGVEHDSGWYLGVAKNLATRGIYASFTNTVARPVVGVNPSIHGRFSVQDKEGHVYFPAGVTVGAGYVVPEAIILKLFGNGWWQYRAWPLIGFTLLFSLASYIVWLFGGFMGFLLFYLWLWVVPQFTMQYAYESYSEDIATLLLLLALTLLYRFLHKRRLYTVFFAGVCIGCSCLTKQLFLLPSLGVSAFVVWDTYMHWKQWPYLLKKWFIFILGVAIPVVGFWGYEYWYLVSHFGLAGWNAVQKDNQLVFISSGSGIGIDVRKLDIPFVIKKLAIWEDVGIGKPLVIWILLLLSPLVLKLKLAKNQKIFFSALFVVITVSFVWFILISPTGWARHIWQGIFIGMMVVSILVGSIFEQLRKNIQKIFYLLGLVSIALIVFNSKTLFPEFFISNNRVVAWAATRNIRGLEGFPSNPVLSLHDQKEAITYFAKNVQEKDAVYYAGWFLNAELSTLVGKVFFPLDRYFAYDETNPNGGKSYLILGPYQQGLWSFEPPTYVPNKIVTLCKQTVFQNNSYVLCELKSGIPMVNPAY